MINYQEDVRSDEHSAVQSMSVGMFWRLQGYGTFWKEGTVGQGAGEGGKSSITQSFSSPWQPNQFWTWNKTLPHCSPNPAPTAATIVCVSICDGAASPCS